MHSYRSHNSTSCHVTEHDNSRFHSVIFCTGHSYNNKSKLSNFIPSPFDAVLNGKCLFIDFDCFIYFADGKTVQSMGHAL